MSKQTTDISLIRKYLNGELDAKAMHRLERRAQDDPFLMEALEGYQNIKTDQQVNLEELTSRINDRVSEKRRRIIPFRTAGIAASILVICSAGWWLYHNSEPNPPPEGNKAATSAVALAAETTAKAKAGTLNLQPNVAAKKAPISKNTSKTPGPVAAIPLADAAVSEKPPVVNEVRVSTVPAAEETKVSPPAQADSQAGYFAPQPKSEQHILKEVTITKPADILKKVPDVKIDSGRLNATQFFADESVKTGDTTQYFSNNVLAKKRFADTVPEQKLLSQAPGVKVYPNSQSAADKTKLLTSGNLGNLPLNQLVNNQVIQGQVIAQDNGLPIKGASVQVSGTSQVARNDAKGNFKIKADTTQPNLVIANHGYQTRRMSASSTDSVKTIALQPNKNDQDLSEVVVTGYTSQPKGENGDFTNAHPENGWSNFKKYLKINAVSPDGKTGMVRLSFSVDKFGSISNIKVLKGLSPAADKKAISLVKDGPEWAGNTDKKPEKITLRIKFGK